MRVAFVWKRLVSRVFHFKLFNTSADVTSYEEPVITLPAILNYVGDTEVDRAVLHLSNRVDKVLPVREKKNRFTTQRVDRTVTLRDLRT